ncbi:MAG TPA: sigma-70 family RNA polymerase sigma factor [Candidatus Bathyarchaeia archaeon]|nr:sigma-70 family RNA polymerase sigma factor [Candidatus Bathyarchaeia archaeon]
MKDLEKNVRKAQQGNSEIFIQLVKQMESSLYSTARAILKKDEDCADALQETILKAYRSLSTLREPHFFKTWLMRILINECNAMLRKRTQTISVAEIPPEASISHNHDYMDLREAVDGLEEQQRLVIVLHYFQDLPLKQVADILGITEGAAKTRLYRARNTLHTMLNMNQEGELYFGKV